MTISTKSLNSDQQFQKIFKVSVAAISHIPKIQLILAIFVEDHSENI